MKFRGKLINQHALDVQKWFECDQIRKLTLNPGGAGPDLRQKVN